MVWQMTTGKDGLLSLLLLQKNSDCWEIDLFVTNRIVLPKGIVRMQQILL